MKANKKNQKPEKALIAVPLVTEKKQLKRKPLHADESILTDAEFLKILLKVKNGNFSQRFPTDQNGIKRSICDTLNEIIDLNERMVFEFQKVEKSIGKQGKLNNRVALDGAH